jgi:hypothetical protein
MKFGIENDLRRAIATKKSLSLIMAFLLNCMASTTLCGQAPPVIKEPKFTSPNVAALGKFGDTPVSYHTGVPEISIPIFTVQEGALSVPITLSYHSSGVRVDDVSSWVGLGWNLSAGGSISRTIHGGPDEGKTQTWTYNSSCGYKGWYRDYGIPDCLDLIETGNYCGSASQNSGRGSNNETTCYAKYVAASYATVDSEPDMYSFSVPGASGKFLFDENRTAHMIPEQDYYIMPEQEPNLFKTWVIIIPDGTKYTFGGLDATEVTHSAPGQVFTVTDDELSSTTWHLIKMESANGNSWIKFDYVKEKYSYGTKASMTYNPISNVGNYQEAHDVTATATVGYRISKITTSSGQVTVDFIANALRQDLSCNTHPDPTKPNVPWPLLTTANLEAKALERIEVIYGDKCKKFVLNTDYFLSDRSQTFGVTPETAFDAKRLKLNSVQESSCDNSIVIPAYQFFYDPTALPRRYSCNQDHWGYANAANNVSLIPPFNHPTSGAPFPGADRSPSESNMKCAILNKIQYPTGGFTLFEYEPHRQSSGSPIIGGLRIKKMTDDDGTGSVRVRNYNYVAGLLFGGVPTYIIDPSTNHNLFEQGASYSFGLIYNSSPAPALQYTHGYHMGYSIVEVSETGNGKSVYTFSNNPPFLNTMGKYPPPPAVAAIGTGKLVKEEHFAENGATPVKRTDYAYVNPTNQIKNINARKIQLLNCFSGGDCSYPMALYEDYFITTYRYNLYRKIDFRDGVADTTYYTYDSNGKHNAPKTVARRNSDGINYVTENIFAIDVPGSVPVSMIDPAQSFYKHMLTGIVESKSMANSEVLSKSQITYSASGTNVLVTTVKEFPTSASTYIQSNYEYDQFGNLLNVRKNDGQNSAFFWGYNNSLVIAAVQNALNAFTENLKTKPFGIQIPGVVSSCADLGSFALAELQTVTFSPSIQLNNTTSWVKLTMKDQAGNIVFGPKQYFGSGTRNESITLPPGTYSFCYQAGFDAGYSGYNAINFVLNYFSGYRRTIFHTSFEENGTVDANYKTGGKVWVGTYPIAMPHINGEYVLSYWQRPNTPNGAWTYQEQTIAISSPTTADLTIGQSGYCIDEVRLHPKGSVMSTYTYLPSIGLLSETDANQLSKFYTYDTMGRLQMIRDDRGQILQTYQYGYKN